MTLKLDRRRFLKSASATVGMIAYGTEATAHATETVDPTVLQATPGTLSGVSYKAAADYPIQEKKFAEVKLTDTFWLPKMKRNAEVTIPFEIQKFEERERPIENNVLEGAIYSLESYPDSRMQGQVNDAVAQIKAAEADGRAMRNDMFEVAVAYYEATGKRDLLDTSIAIANRIYETQLQRQRQKVLGLVGDVQKHRFEILRSLTCDDQYFSVGLVWIVAHREQGTMPRRQRESR